MRDEKGNITFKSVYKWFRSPQGKRYSFVIFYIFFFAALFIFLASPSEVSKEDITKNDNEKIESLPFKTSKLENNNYQFTYKEIINDNEISFQGEKNDDTIILENERDKYDYKYHDGKLVFEGELNPITYFKFLDIYEMKNLIKDATFLTKVEYSNKNIDYNYEITSNKLREFLNLDISYDDDLINKITISCNENLEIYKITLDIYNYWKVENNEDTEVKSYLIELNYGGDYEENSTN